jgi:hypothetical protein
MNQRHVFRKCDDHALSFENPLPVSRRFSGVPSARRSTQRFCTVSSDEPGFDNVLVRA